MRGGETNYVMATLGLFLNIYNLFISLLNLLLAFTGNSANERQATARWKGALRVAPFFRDVQRETTRSIRRARCAGTC